MSIACSSRPTQRSTSAITRPAVTGVASLRGNSSRDSPTKTAIGVDTGPVAI
jgi:hypothetical protein